MGISKILRLSMGHKAIVVICEMYLPCVINSCNISLHFKPWAQNLIQYFNSSTADECFKFSKYCFAVKMTNTLPAT